MLKKLYRRREKLWSQLEGKAGMIQGSLLERYLPCGKKVCKCKQGALHGPFYYLTYLESGKRKSIYIPKKKLSQVKKGMATYNKVKKIMAEIADINHKLLREED